MSYWDSSVFDKARKLEEAELSAIITPPQVVEGVYACVKCKSNKTISTNKQMRGLDESMTVFICCISCGSKWKIN